MPQKLLHRLLLALVGALMLTALAVMFSARNFGNNPIAGNQSRQRTLEVRASIPRPGSTTAPAPAANDKSVPTEAIFEEIGRTLSTAGTQTDGILTINLPRQDLLVYLDGNEVPIAAGVRHQFIFHRCPCGSMLTHGQFVLLNYEINDVIDALRQDPEVKIAGTTPFLLGSEPALTVLRYQAEGDGEHLAGILAGALRWVGEARTAVPQDLP